MTFSIVVDSISIMAEPRFTLIATVRNEASTIVDFIETLLQQTRPSEEILIVDGASTDGTKEILEGYAQRGLLRVISKACNIAQGRNIGIAAATGTHLAVTDAGCRVDPDWLAQIAKAFTASPAPDVVAGNFRFETNTRFEQAVVNATFQPNRDNTQTARYYPSSRSVAFTKAAWEKAGGYPEWLYAAEDTLFNIRLRQLGCHFVFCREAIVQWRPRENWRALARQRINFSRGNARTGIGSSGYVTNLRIHALIMALLLAGFWYLPAAAAALGLFAWHVRRHLWRQAIAATAPDDWRMRLRVLAVMEFVRLVNLYGFVRGRWDRLSDPSYIQNQYGYMGVSSVDHLDFTDPPGQYRRKILRLPFDSTHWRFLAVTILTAVSALAATWVGKDALMSGAPPLLIVAAVTAALLLARSVSAFTQTGPRIPKEILTRYRRYTLFALARLSACSFAIMLFTGGIGVLIYTMLDVTTHLVWSEGGAGLAALLGILGLAALQFLRKLRFNPGLLVASMQYRLSRFYRLWRWLTPSRIWTLQFALLASLGLLLIATTTELVQQENYSGILALWSTLLFYVGTISAATWLPEAPPNQSNGANRRSGRRDLPNIIMIGSDTLRADRLGALGNKRNLTPNIDRLAHRGVLFTNCYVPCARTAPSLVSLLTGTWPHTHGIRDNFVAVEDTLLSVDTLPQVLKTQGYRSAAISDWCGADLGKFSFGFDYTDLPEDQWSLKYLMRQGPKDLRLYLSLFAHNRLGRFLLPEIYFLAGVPLTQDIGRRARRLISRLAVDGSSPFLLNLFYSTTHPPFASEWPWYTRFAGPAYDGESKFAMAKLTDPFDIIRRQGAPKEEFDLDQIIDLYDGCVAEFDDEIGKVLSHLEASGLADNTMVVLYSDHGMEFFEHGTWGQGNSALGDFSARVPLIIADPRNPGGRRVEQVVRTIDVVPTLLELLQAPPMKCDGRSVVPAMLDPTIDMKLKAFNETGIWIAPIPGLPPDHLRYPDLLQLLDVPNGATGTLAIKPEYQDLILLAKDRMVRDGRWKLVYQPLTSGRRLALYDVVADPGCMHDLAADHPIEVSRLWAELREWMAKDPVMSRNANSPGGFDHGERLAQTCDS
jgi:arylsulfatase A-like enzyme/glycosyltransferase involved in cell wall biosynthesis